MRLRGHDRSHSLEAIDVKVAGRLLANAFGELFGELGILGLLTSMAEGGSDIVFCQSYTVISSSRSQLFRMMTLLLLGYYCGRAGFQGFHSCGIHYQLQYGSSFCFVSSTP